MGREILVDGYNVIKRNASFQVLATKNLAAAREQLIAQLASRYRHSPHQVIVVFDGSGSSEQVSHDRHIRIIYSRHGETADSVIARLASSARSAGREVEMYSDDSEVRQAVTRHGGSVRTTGQLTDHLNAPPRDIARRARHRIAMRQKYGLDPLNKDEDEPERPRSHPHKKKKSRR